jgi:hypothetical protein
MRRRVMARGGLILAFTGRRGTDGARIAGHERRSQPHDDR